MNNSSRLWLPAGVNRGLTENRPLLWEQMPVPPVVYNALRAAGAKSVRGFSAASGLIVALVAVEPILAGGLDGYHMSISHRDRYPTWDEQRGARYALIPEEACMVQVLPPRTDYLNVHENTFHWWQVSLEHLPFVPLGDLDEPGE